MPPVIVTQGVLVRLIWAQSGTPIAVNVLGALNPSAQAITQALTNTVGAAIKTALTSSTQVARMHPSYSLANVGLRSIAAPAQPEFLDAGAAVVGTGAGAAPLPPQTAFCVTLRTALAGKHYRGRVYLPGYDINGITAAGIAGAVVGTAAVNFLTAIQSALSSSNFNLAVLSRSLGTGQAVTLIQSRDLAFETQRRRSYPGI